VLARIVLRGRRVSRQLKRDRLGTTTTAFPSLARTRDGRTPQPPHHGPAAEMEESYVAAAASTAVQLIDGEGEFAGESAERFMATAGVAGCGLSYAVVSIMGPQSSGTYACCAAFSSIHTQPPAVGFGPANRSNIDVPAGQLFDEIEFEFRGIVRCWR
jgi:hypothetical protein